MISLQNIGPERCWKHRPTLTKRTQEVRVASIDMDIIHLTYHAPESNRDA